MYQARINKEAFCNFLDYPSGRTISETLLSLNNQTTFPTPYNSQ